MILVIERNELHHKLIHEALSENYSLVYIKDSSELAHKAMDKPRLILLNLYQAQYKHDHSLDWIQSECNGRVPVLFILEKHSPLLIKKAFELGAQDVLVFPTTHEYIKRRVDGQFQLNGLKSMLNVQQRTGQDNWSIMDRYLPFLFINLKGEINFFSDALSQALSVNKNSILGVSFIQFAQRHSANVDFEEFFDKSRYEQFMEIPKEERHWVIRDQNAEGDQNWYRLTLVPRYDGFNIWVGFSLFYQNINDTIKLKSLAEKDALTKIANRLTLNQTLQSEIDRANRIRDTFSVIMFDIDNFKEVNDCYGHLVGDQVLTELTKIISLNSRKIDVFGRWGGEEFMVICPHTNERGAVVLAEKYKQVISKQKFSTVDQLSCSFGVSEYPLDTDANMVIDHADRALYRAKDGGRNRVEYFSRYEYL